MNIAVTGGLGSGKSTVSRILTNSLGAQMLNSDALCREELLPGEKGLVAVQKRWGQRFLLDSGALDRTALRVAAFDDPSLLAELENILHPFAHRKVLQAIAAGRKNKSWLVVEVPLLFEVGWQEDFDVVVVVRSKLNDIFTRVADRDQRSKKEIQKILAVQLPLKEKVRLADYCIDNSGIFIATVEQVAWLRRELQKKSKQRDDKSAKKA